MDPECPQFHVSEVMKMADKLMKTKVTTANRFPGRSLFGTTLDSKGLDKELAEEEQLPNKSKSCRQPGSPLVQGADNAHRTQPLRSPKPGRCLDSEMTTRPKTESAESAVGSRQTPARDRDCQTQLNKSPNTQAVSPERRIAEQQIGSEVIPAQGGTPDLQRATPGMRSPLCETPERPPAQEEECLIPKNIQHKFRTHVVNEVLSDEKVKEFLYQKQLSAGNLDSKDTTAETQKSIIDETNTYEQIGYPLRCNIFPGFSGGWKSEAQSTYTKEVVDRFKRDPEHWHGRTSDDLGARTDTLLAHERSSRTLQQYLEEQPKLARTWRRLSSKPCQRAATTRPGQPKARKKAAAKPPATVPKTKQPVAKPEGAEAPGGRGESETTAERIDKKDEVFWEFYDQPLPPL